VNIDFKKDAHKGKNLNPYKDPHKV
ncbi:uncharacterized protein METZ01_LOCUS407055, partial [marine metagenome]